MAEAACGGRDGAFEFVDGNEDAHELGKMAKAGALPSGGAFWIVGCGAECQRRVKIPCLTLL